ncbi:hypothetical protein [Photobacterium profundum]|uniref:Lipoprotein n=1 Tax=Photobacterium profundum (strain SS9) TaxID=298386 RepID=Q6LL60_PHOPR|nr:hypothetical protein [Photobacterium profundum]CAG21914.1 hypothetical protein PBPRB0041 [Photobacterium profundum SS9]
MKRSKLLALITLSPFILAGCQTTSMFDIPKLVKSGRIAPVTTEELHAIDKGTEVKVVQSMFTRAGGTCTLLEKALECTDKNSVYKFNILDGAVVSSKHQKIM